MTACSRSFSTTKTPRPLRMSGAGGSGRSEAHSGTLSTNAERSVSTSDHGVSPVTPRMRLSRQTTRPWTSSKRAGVTRAGSRSVGSSSHPMGWSPKSRVLKRENASRPGSSRRRSALSSWRPRHTSISSGSKRGRVSISPHRPSARGRCSVSVFTDEVTLPPALPNDIWTASCSRIPSTESGARSRVPP